METRIETNKFVHGISMCHIAFRKPQDTPEGLPQWDTPTALPGAVKLEDSHKGEEQIKYADNGAYVVISNSIGSEVKLAVVRLPLDLRAKMFNDRIDANGGVVKGQSNSYRIRTTVSVRRRQGTDKRCLLLMYCNKTRHIT